MCAVLTCPVIRTKAATTYLPPCHMPRHVIAFIVFTKYGQDSAEGLNRDLNSKARVSMESGYLVIL